MQLRDRSQTPSFRLETAGMTSLYYVFNCKLMTANCKLFLKVENGTK